MKLLRNTGFTFILPGHREKWADLYQEIGEIRDCQIGYKLVQRSEKKLNVVFPYSHEIEQRELDTILQFHQNHDRQRRTLLNDYLNIVDERLVNAAFDPALIDEYVANKIGALRAAIDDCKQFGNNLHRLRKILKDLLNTLIILDEMNASANWAEEVKEWKAFSKALGDWNDLNTASEEIIDNKRWIQRIKLDLDEQAKVLKKELFARIPYWEDRGAALAEKWNQHEGALLL